MLQQLARNGGKAALDEALAEAGVKSVGHRLKILNALIDEQSAEAPAQ